MTEVYNSQVFQQYTNRKNDPVILGLGLFDGVHQGHQEIVRKVLSVSWKTNGIPSLFTFSNPPESVVAPNRVPFLLTTPRTKISICSHMGIEKIFIPEFTREMALLTPEEFVEKILMEKIRVKSVVAGFNYKFGADKKGDIETLKAAGEKYGFEVLHVAPVMYRDVRVSSTRIRNALASGSLEVVSDMLGRPYQIEGEVIKGSGIASEMVVPTANLQLPCKALIPYGVYIVRIQRFTEKIPCWEGPVYHGIMNYGLRPTLRKETDKPEPVAEVHLFDYRGDLYGDELGVAVLEFIRDEIKFPDSEALQAQIRDDVEYALSVIKDKTLPENLLGI